MEPTQEWRKEEAYVYIYFFLFFSHDDSPWFVCVKIAASNVARTCDRRVRGGTGRGGASFSNSQLPPILLEVGGSFTTIICGGFGGGEGRLGRGRAGGGEGRSLSSDTRIPPILLGAGGEPAKAAVGGSAVHGQGRRVHGGTTWRGGLSSAPRKPPILLGGSIAHGHSSRR